MVCRKQEETDKDEQARRKRYLSCQVCGRIVKPEASSWGEDEGGGIYCQDCKAETESCGCSD